MYGKYMDKNKKKMSWKIGSANRFVHCDLDNIMERADLINRSPEICPLIIDLQKYIHCSQS